MTEGVKTTEDVTEELNKLLAENNMALDVSAILRTTGIAFSVKVRVKDGLEAKPEDAGQ